ncbi:MAG: hypothetical protein RMK91_12365 [Pseudanabaenaceae cyanobacterium SKYGB_i_bin29]|nr:hypothetical protein [Pseudanabaenaceae cyanobacterium SKYG29]MDW8422648.1 hypothetical protein [Pseudanabaenaceae cyanobacterium SKYGB_i_bin29]
MAEDRTFQVTVRAELLPKIEYLAAREGCSLEAMIELLLEEKLSEVKTP